MSKTSLRYARALALALGEKAPAAELKEVADELDLAAEVLSAKNIQSFFANPKVETANKEKVVVKVFAKFSEKIINLLRLIVRFEKTSEIENIATSFRAVLNESAGIATATIESASKLDEKEIVNLAAALKKMTGSEVAVETKVEPKILGGVKVILGDELIDLSLLGKLGRLQKALS